MELQGLEVGEFCMGGAANVTYQNDPSAASIPEKTWVDSRVTLIFFSLISVEIAENETAAMKRNAKIKQQETFNRQRNLSFFLFNCSLTIAHAHDSRNAQLTKLGNGKKIGVYTNHKSSSHPSSDRDSGPFLPRMPHSLYRKLPC